MNCFVAGLLFMLLTVSVPSADAAIGENRPGITCSTFDSFSTCVSSPTTAGRTVFVDTVMPVNNISVSADRTVQVRGGGFLVNPGKVLVFAKDPVAGSFQIYHGSGTVTGLKETIPEHFGAKGDGQKTSAAANTLALAKMSQAGSKTYTFSGTYYINGSAAKTDNAVMKWVKREDLKFKFNDVKFINVARYSVDDRIHAIFEFERCKNISLGYFEYQGQDPWATSIDDKKSGLGYVGETVVYFHSGSAGLNVEGSWKNARYGILSGNYATPSLGNCSNIRAKLSTYTVGYPVAFYLVDRVDLDIHAVNTHRAVYLAGVHGGKVTAAFRNQHIAPVQVLLTDAKMSGTEPHSISRGCSGLQVTAIDEGSTQYVPNSYVAGISLSRVDKGTKFSNLKFDVQITGTDHKASTIGAFLINSVSRLYQKSYSFNWDSTIILENITLSGVVDRRSQTVPNHAYGEVVIRTSDSVGHSATINGLVFENLRLYGGTSVKHNGINMLGFDPAGTIKFVNCDLSSVKNKINFPDGSKIIYDNSVF